MKKIDLNPWYALLWRRFDRRVRKIYFAINTPARQKLWTERRYLAHADTLTEEEDMRLGEIGHILGDESIYRFTPEQIQEQSVLMRQILAELKEERETKG